MSPVSGFPSYENDGQERKNVYDCPRRGECELYINQNSRCRIVLEDGDAPKATDRLMERRNMDFHSSTPQSLNVSRSISGSGGTEGGSEPACG